MVNLASLNSFFPYFLKMREKKTKPVVYNVHFSSNFTEEKNFLVLEIEVYEVVFG